MTLFTSVHLLRKKLPKRPKSRRLSQRSRLHEGIVIPPLSSSPRCWNIVTKKFGIIIQTEETILEIQRCNTTHQAQVFPSSIAATKELHIMGNELKGKVLKWHQKMSFWTHFSVLCTPEHMVHANALGVAGIVVKRDVLITTGEKHCPSIQK
jgi:hypothetical protein